MKREGTLNTEESGPPTERPMLKRFETMNPDVIKARSAQGLQPNKRKDSISSEPEEQ